MRQFTLGLLLATTMASAFIMPSAHIHTRRVQILRLADDTEEGVIELGDDDDVVAPAAPKEESPMAPFLSQSNEIADDVLNPDLSDPKQSRVIIYIIISLIPVLFLIPLMLGSRDLIPLDAMPPVDL